MIRHLVQAGAEDIERLATLVEAQRRTLRRLAWAIHVMGLISVVVAIVSAYMPWPAQALCLAPLWAGGMTVWVMERVRRQVDATTRALHDAEDAFFSAIHGQDSSSVSCGE